MIFEAARHVDQCPNGGGDPNTVDQCAIGTIESSRAVNHHLWRTNVPLSRDPELDLFRTHTVESPEHRSGRVRHQRPLAGPEHSGKCGLSRCHGRSGGSVHAGKRRAHSPEATRRAIAWVLSRKSSAWLVVINRVGARSARAGIHGRDFLAQRSTRAHEIAGVCQLPPRRAWNRRFNSCGFPCPAWPHRQAVE